MTEPVLPRNVWIDVEDLFQFAVYNPRPSGIQRMAFELYRAIQQLEGKTGRINFVRHDHGGGTFIEEPWQSVEALFNRLARGTPPLPQREREGVAHRTAGGARAESMVRRAARKLAYRMPLELRYRVFTAARQQAAAFSALADLVRFAAGGLLRGREAGVPASGTGQLHPPPTSRAFAKFARPGDIILLLGAPWASPNYVRMIEAARAKYGIEFAVLIYDLIPIWRPEWCDRGVVRLFGQWFSSALPASDHIFTISRSTAADLTRYMHYAGLSNRTTSIKVIPVGTSFGEAPLPALPGNAVVRPGLPQPGTYVLFVSTIEARKNHMLLFRVWRQLIETMPADAIPTLVFAGCVGWMVADLMQQLDNTDWLDGKIRLIEAPADQDIAALYQGCMFTLFPSLYEGWGLPVTESLANGKPCLASNATSMPEAGGKLARYFDPDSVTDAYRVIRATIEDKPGLAAWQAEVARSFRPVAWTETAATILDTLGARSPQPFAARPKQPAE